MDLRLEDHVAIVTGASRGLGFAAAQALADEGARVLATARTQVGLDELVASRPGRIVAAACDIRDQAEVEALPQRALDAFGRLDIVVNNAGIAPAGKFLDQDAELMEEIFRVNVLAPGWLSRAAGRHLVAQRRGKIVNVSSISGIRGKARLVSYSASKGGIIQLTKALAAEWARHNVQVNAIAPGFFETEAQQQVLDQPEILKARLSKIPARRAASPDEIGPFVCLLASPRSDFMTGSVVVVDGGETAKI
jgi:2-deoxy-D-gluconate 3-dehydrogenase